LFALVGRFLPSTSSWINNWAPCFFLSDTNSC
jgi:hypothetical protein